MAIMAEDSTRGRTKDTKSWQRLEVGIVVEQLSARDFLAASGLWQVSGQVETDKWPLEELARLRGRATSAHRVRRGRVSFDG